MTYSKDNPVILPASSKPAYVVFSALAIVFIALLFRTSLLGVPGQFDEYYHLLAARGWLETGRPTILDGEYTRATGFTGAVAWLFSVTGSTSMATGRLVALAAGVLIPLVLFIWLKARVGWIAGLTAAGLAILWPQGIWESQMLRFYSWHGLFFLIGTIATFEAVEARGLRRALWGGMAVLFLVLAYQLQLTTLIGIAAILVWIGGALILPALWNHPGRWVLLGGLVAATVAVVAVFSLNGTFADLWERYRWTPGWNAHLKDQVTYYSIYLRKTYPALWPLFPIAALLACRQWPRITLFCALIFTIIFLGQSFGGMKAIRYLSFGMPFFFAVFALAASDILPAAGSAVLRGADALNPTRFRWISQGFVIGGLAFAALLHPFVSSSLKAVTGRSVSPAGAHPPDWSRLPALIGDWQESPFRLILMDELQPIYALGDYDVLFSPTRMDELKDKSEFSVDPRTGRPVVAELETVAAILRCEPEGLLLMLHPRPPRWNLERQENWLPLFEAAGRTVETRQKNGVLALHWSGGASDSNACAALPL